MKKFLPFAGLLVLVLFAGPARAANFWFDFDHDNALGTIQPNTSRSVDTLSVVLDLTGLSVTAPFTLTWQALQEDVCFPNHGHGGVALIDTLGAFLSADADSFEENDVTPPNGDLTTEFVIHFISLPAITPFVATRLILTYPGSETQPCTNAGAINFSAATVSGAGTVGAPHLVKIKDSDIGVHAATWGQLRQVYR